MADKMINDKQITVLCHVDDLKMPHVDSFLITKFAGYLSSIYVGITLNRIKLHYYSVMELD